uniref:Uncharacterized protein n=1 Tax=Rhizophora mucronata TaxID=61149 RepID=A0A2P2NVI9_RHIMU
MREACRQVWSLCWVHVLESSIRLFPSKMIVRIAFIFGVTRHFTPTRACYQSEGTSKANIKY